MAGVGAARVQVLGPVRVATRDGAIVDVPGTNGKALIVSLVLAKGAVVSVNSLIDDIWQDDPPRNARAALQTLVSRVRAVAGDELIESVAGGYRLGTDAVDLWVPGAPRRGEPGADLGTTELAERLRETADDVRTRALEERVTDALRTGNPAPAVVAARALVDGAPYDERAHLLLMKALTADGRRGEALRVFADFKQRLGDELGARPGPELVAANAALLRNDAATTDAGPFAGAASDAGAFGSTAPAPASAAAEARPALPSSAPGSPAASGPGNGSPNPAVPAAPKRVTIGLRAAPNQLIGRDADVAALERLMASSRLTTILGPGGLGKTRLAQELANRAAQATPGVVVVELAGIREADDVPLAVAATLGIGEMGSARVSLRDPIVLLEVRTRIRAALAERETLLVLDNCEHVIEGAAQLVDQVLSENPTVRVLATSRAPLQLGAESVYPLGSLSAVRAGDEAAPHPQDGEGNAPATPAGYGPAVQLFIERARAARPGASLPIEAVARLCEHLDGLPLAIELAAARIRSMSVDEIERRLSNRFALLRGGDRSAPERHRTLIAVIDWSWNLLAESERRMLRRLSAFSDGFSADAAAALALADRDGDGGHDGGADDSNRGESDQEARLRASDDLDALVTQSLVSVTERPTGLRYRMLETVREFGNMALVDAGEDELVAAASARWARGFAQDALAAMPTRRQTAAVVGLEVEHDNLVAVLRAASEAGDADTIVPLFAALLFHWLVRNQFREAMSFAPSVASVVAAPELPRGAPDAAAVTLLFAAIMGVAGARAPRPRANRDPRAGRDRNGNSVGIGPVTGGEGRNRTGNSAAAGTGTGTAGGTAPGTRDDRGAPGLDREQPDMPAELQALQEQYPPGEMFRAGVRAGVRLRRLIRSGAVSPWLAETTEMIIAGAHDARQALPALARLRSSSDEVVRVMGNLFSGVLAENTGDIETAFGYNLEAWHGSTRLGLDWIAGHAAHALANVASQDDRPAESLHWAERARERLAAIGAVEEINQSDWTAGMNRLKLGRREGVAESFERFVSGDNTLQQEGFDFLDIRAIGWAGLAEIAAEDGRPDETIELYRRAVSVYGARPGVSAQGAWYLISSAGAIAASVYLDRVDDAALAMWRHLRIGARVELRQRGGPDFVDRPVLATAALGVAIGTLGFPQATDAQHTTGAELVALAERMHSRQDQPMLVRSRAFAFTERVVGESAVRDARARVAALPDLTACTARLDELLRALAGFASAPARHA